MATHLMVPRARADDDPTSARSLNALHRETYDRIAGRYAIVNAEMVPMVTAAAERFLSALGRGARILDLGCGHGRDMAWFEAAGARIIGADLSKGMLARARPRVDGPLLFMDMRRPAFRGAAFDGVWCNATLLHLPRRDVPATLAQLRRLLVPNGLAFFSVQIGAGETWEPTSYGEPAARFYYCYGPGAFDRLLQEAGLSLVSREESRVDENRHWAHYLAKRPG